MSSSNYIWQPCCFLSDWCFEKFAEYCSSFFPTHAHSGRDFERVLVCTRSHKQPRWFWEKNWFFLPLWSFVPCTYCGCKFSSFIRMLSRCVGDMSLKYTVFLSWCGDTDYIFWENNWNIIVFIGKMIERWYFYEEVLIYDFFFSLFWKLKCYICKVPSLT